MIPRPARPAAHRVPLLVLAAVASLAAPAFASLPPTRGQTLFTTCDDARTLRVQLTRLVDSTHAQGRAAGDAFYCRALSLMRAGKRDSAIADFRQAVSQRGAPVDQLALADALIDRATAADLAECCELADQASESGMPYEIKSQRARLGWALFLRGLRDSADRVFEPMAGDLEVDPLWRERLARVASAARPNDAKYAFATLFPIAVRTRGANRDVMDSLAAVVARDPRTRGMDVAAAVRTAIARADAAERMTLESRGGRVLRFAASDGFPISAALFPLVKRAPVAVMLLAPEDSLTGYDSLVVALHGAGVAALLVERRGSRGAAGPGCAGPSDFHGREDALEERIARDALEALRHAASEAPLDPARVVFGGTLRAAPTAILAALRHGHARALLLASPEPEVIQLGPACAWLRKLRLPMFIQLAPEDYDVELSADALYQAGFRSRSRVASSRAPGRGAEPFRGDPDIRPRLQRWLEDTLTSPAVPATPRPAPRKG